MRTGCQWWFLALCHGDTLQFSFLLVVVLSFLLAVCRQPTFRSFTLMRILLIALMVVWLLVGCATPQEPESTPGEQIMTFDAPNYTLIRAESPCAEVAL